MLHPRLCVPARRSSGGREQRGLYLRREPDFTDWHVIRQLWQLAHFPFAFSAAIRTPNFPISSRMSRHTGPAGSLRAVSSSFSAIASSCCISVRVRSTDTLAIPTWGLLLSISFILTSHETPVAKAALFGWR